MSDWLTTHGGWLWAILGLLLICSGFFSAGEE